MSTTATSSTCDSVCVEREHDQANGEGRIVDFSLGRCSTDGLIRELWNSGKAKRARCREMLEEWCDVLEKRKSRTCRRKAPIETRMDEICRVLKFNDVEREILIYAVVRPELHASTATGKRPALPSHENRRH